MSDATVLVTRPRGQQKALMVALEGAGFQCRHAPLIEIFPFDAPDKRQRQLLLNLCDFQHLVFVSRNAIEYGMAWIEDYWPQLPAGLNWYAVGRSSARMLQEYGVRPLSPRREMNSEGLLALPSLQQVAEQRVLIVKGEGGRHYLRETLQERGARVDELAVYRRTSPAYAEGELASRILGDGCNLILLSSGEGLHNMVSLLDTASLAAVQALTLVVPGQRVAEQAREAGFKVVRIADSATDEDMVTAARVAAAAL